MKIIATIFLLLICSYSVSSEDINKTYYNIYFSEDIRTPPTGAMIHVSVARKHGLKDRDVVYGKDKMVTILMNATQYEIDDIKQQKYNDDR